MTKIATIVVLVLFAAAAGGCGVETGDGTFSEIPRDEIQFGLDDTTTTSTTSTTTMPAVPDTAALETTTTLAVDQVEIYFVSRGGLQPVLQPLARDYGPEQVAAALEKGPPPGAPGVGLDTLIEQGLITSSAVAGGIITIDLDPEIFGRIADFDQAGAIGQIVLTMTSNVPRVGLVLFTLGGEPVQVKKGDSLLSAPDEAVSFDDYRELLASTPPTTTTTTTTTIPETTVVAVPALESTTVPG